MKFKFIYLLVINFILTVNLNAQDLSNDNLLEPMSIEVSDSDSTIFYKKSINGCIKKIELAKDELYKTDSSRFFSYKNNMINRIKLLTLEKNNYEGKF
jgi:hypothetical protein